MESSRFLPDLELLLVVLLLRPLVGTTHPVAPSLLAFAESPICADHVDLGQRALCQALAALELATPSIESSSGGADQTPSSSNKRRSRYWKEGGPNLHRYAAEQSGELELLLQAYSCMHASCNRVDRANLSTQSTRAQVHCKYLVWSCTFGLGNQLMSLVSAFLLSILSQRVLLLDNPTWDQLFSEPFEGSSWLAPRELSFEGVETPTVAEFQTSGCDESLRAGSTVDERCHTDVLSIVFSLASRVEDHKLLVCPSSILALRNITFFNMRNSNQHFALGFYLNPALRPLLDLLFPQRNVFHALSRSLLLPSDAVWGQIQSHGQQVLNASRRIGVQLRESKGDYRHYFDDAVPSCIERISKLCLIEAEVDEPTAPPAEFVSVYVSSLVGGHFTKLQERIPHLEAETRQRFVLLSQPADGEQIDDIAHQQKALVDIWILSLSDVLLTTHMSTFGYTAHALAGITPHHLKHWPDNPCQLSLSNDPCYHFAPKHVSCPSDGFVLQDPRQEVTYIKECPDIAETGLQLQEPEF